ncbi:MAG: murein biosynthesis integral membrane protein MurJ [Candidatus Paceibacterota bacterium]
MILNRQFKTLLGASALLAFFNLASRLMGLIRDRILASRFGASDILDVYYISFQIPDFIFNLLAVGAISTAFIPLFIEYETKKGKESAWKLTSNFLNLLLVAVFAGVALLFILTPWLISIISPGFAPEKKDLAILFTRVMLISPLLFTVSIIAGSVLQATNRFLAFASAPLAYNAGIIIGAVILEPKFGPLGLAEGVVLGALLHLIVQFPSLRRTGFRWFKVFDFKDEGVRKMLKLILPRSFGLAAVQVNWTVLNALATTLGVGTVATLNFAFNLHFVPVALIGISVAVASFPTMSREALLNNNILVSRISRTLNGILILVIPLSFLFIYLREDVVRILLGSGLFGPSDIRTTADILGFFILGVFAQSAIPVLARTFYAIQNTIIPVLAGIISVAFNIFLAFWLLPEWGVLALPLSYALAGILNFIVLLWFLKRKMAGFSLSMIAVNFSKIVYVSMAMILVLTFVDVFVNFGTNLAGSLLKVLALSLLGALTFWIFSRMLGIKFH